MPDVSHHVLVVRILAEYGNPQLRFGDYFAVEWSLTPTVLFYLLMVPLQKLVGPYTDARLYLTVWVVLLWLSVWYLAKVRCQPDPWVPALAALPLAFCWYAYQGFLPFLMTLPLFALTVGVWCGELPPAKKVALVWGLLVLLFGFHIVGAAAAAATIAVVALCDVYLRKAERRELAIAAFAVLPVPLLTAAYLFGQSRPSAHIEFAGLLQTAVDVAKFTLTTLDDRASILMFVWAFLLAVVLLAYWRDLVDAVPMLLAAAVLVVLAIAIPSSLGALWPAGPRLLPFALILLIVSLPFVRLGEWSGVAASFALVIGLSAFTVHHIVRLDRGLRDFLAGAEFLEPGKSILYIPTGQYEGSRTVNPYWSLTCAYTVMRGGSHPYVLATPHIKTGASPLRYRRESDRQYAFLYDRARTAADYAGVSMAYDYVLLWGSSPDIAAVLGKEMKEIYVRGPTTLYASSRQNAPQGGAELQPATHPSAGTP